MYDELELDTLGDKIYDNPDAKDGSFKKTALFLIMSDTDSTFNFLISMIYTNISTAIWSCMGYTVLLCFTLFKTGSLAKSLFNSH